VSLLTIVQQAFGEIGLVPPGSVVGNTDQNAVKAFAQANRAALELRDSEKAADYWQGLRKQYLFNLAGTGPFTGTFTPNSNVITGVVFTGSGGGWASLQAGWQVSSTYVTPDTMISSFNQGAQTVTMTQVCNLSSTASASTDSYIAFGQEAYPVPSDLNYFIPQTGWDRSFRWQLLGPVNAQEWQVLKSGISPVGPRLRYRLMNNEIFVNPSPYVTTGATSPVTDLLCLEYCSVNWCGPAGSTATPSTQALFQLDTDVCVAFPEDLITLALKWRMLRANGFSYDEEFDEYDKALARRAGRETMPRALPLNARASGIRLLNSQNVPDTGFGS
jgi:hypothetical protein